MPACDSTRRLAVFHYSYDRLPLTRARAGLQKSFHGSSDVESDDFLVHTSLGLTCGRRCYKPATAVRINAVEFPSALALSARKEIALIAALW